MSSFIKGIQLLALVGQFTVSSLFILSPIFYSKFTKVDMAEISLFIFISFAVIRYINNRLEALLVDY